MKTAAKRTQGAPPPERWGHKTIGEQVRSFVSGELSPDFRRLNASFVDNIAAQDATDACMDGWIVHPKPTVLAGSGTGERDWPTVSRALAAVLRLFGRRDRRFIDLTKGLVGPERYRVQPKTLEAFAELEQRLPGDFVVYRAQTGMRRRTTVSEARASLEAREFGLDALSIGCFLLVHPERLVGLEAPGITCMGSEYRKAPVGEFSLCPSWVCFDGAYGVGLGLADVNQPDDALGCASGLL